MSAIARTGRVGLRHVGRIPGTSNRPSFFPAFGKPNTTLVRAAEATEGVGDAATGTSDSTPDVSKLDVGVGTIRSAEEHPEADSVCVEQIDLGEEEGPRTMLSVHIPPSTPSSDTRRRVFSFGALMAPRCLAQRAITPLSSSVARLADEKMSHISFSHRAAYATLVHNDGSHRSEKTGAVLTRERPFGVIHELTADDFAKVSQREVGYRISKVTVERLDCNPPECITVDAFTSAAGMELRDGPLPPTARYQSLLLEGLEHHGIRYYEGGPQYVGWVQALPTVDSVGSDPRYGKTYCALWTQAGFALCLLTCLYLVS